MQLSLLLDGTQILPWARGRLLTAFGPQRDSQRHDPLSQLVRGIVSAQTRDIVSAPAFHRLIRAYPSWDVLSRTPARDIEAIIRPVTHPERKAEHIPAALRMIAARTGALSLAFLADWNEEMAHRWLDGLPGVGPKIAAAVLNFSTLRKRDFAVDRHVLRVGQRMGFVAPRADYEGGYESYRRLIPDVWDADDLYELHWLIKYHGQLICTYALPDCGRCSLADRCPSAKPPASAPRQSPTSAQRTSVAAPAGDMKSAHTAL